MLDAIYEIPPRGPLPPLGSEEVGNKAWNLMRMASAGLRVPPAFVLPTQWCHALHKQQLDETRLAGALSSGVASLESATGLQLGSPRRPLLVSVRSGAQVSMPGMLETVLDIGLNLETVRGLIGLTGNPRLAWDSYRRLVQGYAEIVEGLPHGPFEELVAHAVSRAEVESDRELDHVALRDLTCAMLDRFSELRGFPFPQDAREQLNRSVIAVLRSWQAPKATTYRRMNGILENGGTAVAVQSMVFGNAGGASGSGVAFTHNPATGDRELFFDFRFNAQGEDVVGGRLMAGDNERLLHTFPSIWRHLQETGKKLEALFRDAQDFEFTLESGSLFLLQSREAKRTPWAALRIAVDLAEKSVISPQEALDRLANIDLALVRRTRPVSGGGQPLARGLPASLGVASGVIALDSETAAAFVDKGSPVIFVRRETATSDIEGILKAAGILTAAGGRTSHAAVVARQFGKVCVVGCSDLHIDLARRACRIGPRLMKEGDLVSLDGNEGYVYAGRLETVAERPERELAAIAAWQRDAALKPAVTAPPPQSPSLIPSA